MDKKIIVGCLTFLFVWLSFLTQINVLNEFELFGAKCNIAVIVVVGLALLSGKIPGMLIGILYGIIYDITFGKSIGIYTLLYGFTGFLLGQYSNGFSKENRLSVIYMVGLATIVIECITYVVFIVLYGYSFEVVAPIALMIKEFIYNMILARLLYPVITGLSEIMNKCKNSYYLL